MVKFNYFSGRPNKVKKKLETFLMDYSMQAIFEIKIFRVRNKIYLYKCHPPCLCKSVHTKCYIYNSLVHVTYVLRACLKVTIIIFYFCHSKNPSNIMKNVFNSIFIYSWKKTFSCQQMQETNVLREN